MKSTANGLKWSAIERLSTHAIQLVVMLYLARLLGPGAFGLMGILAVFIAIGQTLVNSGFSSALIRETKRTESDFSTTFYFNIGVGVACYSILFFIAPYIAIFFEQPLLTQLLRVLGITVILNSLAIVQQAKLTIMMDFKTQAKASLISVLISSCFAIWLANLNYGVWVLVWQALVYSACNSLILIFLCKWLPTTGFSKQSFNYLFGFGSKLLAAALLNTVFVNIYQVIIGKQFNSSQVGLFTQANQLANVPAITLTTVIQRVTYPMLSNIQNDTNKFESTYLLTLRFAGAVVFPLMIGLSLIATPLITVALGEQWLASAPLLSILCFAFILYPIHAINLNLLNVKGRSDIFLKLEIIKKSLIVLMLFITIPLGIKAMCIGMVGNSFIAFFINSFYTGKFSQLNTKKQLKALLPLFIGAFLCAVITCGITLFLSNIMMLGAYIQLFISLTFMPLLYGMFIRFLQPDLYLQFKMALCSENKISQ
ncbi:lipopolysaccharide biosynthesis protein [Pseudoalteromonas fuliginea]|uniref:Lipopolysaccharide biosynthesis protein n=1 Tax=Pseudoalteromonas fuliginea TaxID=1872678 RepID=A0AB73BMZ6_9GAMM|nr:lipopolysaccharide biosynthesis protein [Pseudoalteromonas fuliginea]KAA1166154.1 lipopolysaccharide biosynthesis protein [Pseudoalteromonas fuliginea]